MSSLLLQCFLVCLLLSEVGAAGHSASWSYEGETGPEHWCIPGENECCGNNQSPIALGKSAAINCANSPLVFGNYDVVSSSITATNNGHSVAVKLGDNVVRTVSGGGLDGAYILDSFHYHWGKDSRSGSEHTLYGAAYPMELHLVHYSSRYASLTDAVAAKDPNALAVVGVMYRLSIEDNPFIGFMTNQFSAITYFSQVTTLVQPFALSGLLPNETRSFFRYQGSLTTPGCNEAVVWTVMQQPTTVSEAQMCNFRTLKSSSEGEMPEIDMSGNFRPVQPLNGRSLNLIVTN